MLSPTIETVLFIIVLVALSIAATQRHRFLFAIGFLMPMAIPAIRVGIGVEWHKIAGPIAITFGIIAYLAGSRPLKTKSKWLLWVIVYTIVLSVFWMGAEYLWLERYRTAKELRMGAGAGQQFLKMPVQLGSYLFQMSAVFIVPFWARTLRDTKVATIGFLTGCALSFFAGLVAVLMTGSGTITRQVKKGLYVAEGISVPRIGGLSGEPKVMGACLVMVLALLIAHQMFGRKRGTRRDFVLLGAVTIALFFTYSTSAWVAAAVVLIAAVLLGLKRFGASRIRGLVLLGIALFAITTTVGVVGGTLETRFRDRLWGNKSEVAMQKDMYVFMVLRDNPTHIPFGYGPGGADLAVMDYVEWLHLKYRRTPTPGLMGVRLLGDLGLFGIILLSAIALAWSRHLSRSGDRVGAAFVVIGLAGMPFASSVGLALYLFLTGSFLAAASIREKEAYGDENDTE